MEYKDSFNINITMYLNHNKNASIKKILDILDISDVTNEHRKKIRQIVLDEINEFHIACCRVLTFIQEAQDGKDGK